MVLLSLDEYDTAKDPAGRRNALNGIKATCEYFYTMREELLKTYSKTRFMEQPEGYLRDQNRHGHLANQTLNSDWVFLHELPMVKAMEEWIEIVKD